MELIKVEALSYIFNEHSMWHSNCGQPGQARLLCSNPSLKGPGKDQHLPGGFKKENLWAASFWCFILFFCFVFFK